VLAVLLGPRLSHAQTVKKVQPHNVPFAILGASLLWFGWSGFNGGSALAADGTAALALANTYMSGAASLVTWVLLERMHFQRSSATGAVTGAIVGLVIITPAAGFVRPLSATVMGMAGCAMVYPTFHLNHHKVDDALHCFPCHGIASLVGAILTGIFSTEGGLVYGGGLKLLLAQLVGAVVVAVYASIMTTAIFFALRLCMPMRVAEELEHAGLDGACHGESAYPAPEASVHAAEAGMDRARDADLDLDAELGEASVRDGA